jgi:hypothetical protein
MQQPFKPRASTKILKSTIFVNQTLLILTWNVTNTTRKLKDI